MGKLVYKHREIKQVDNFKVGDTYQGNKIVSFRYSKDGIIMFLHKLTNKKQEDLRTKPFGINLNKILTTC